MTSQKLILELFIIYIYSRRLLWYFMVNLQLTVVLTVGTVAGRFLAYIT